MILLRIKCPWGLEKERTLMSNHKMVVLHQKKQPENSHNSLSLLNQTLSMSDQQGKQIPHP